MLESARYGYARPPGASAASTLHYPLSTPATMALTTKSTTPPPRATCPSAATLSWNTSSNTDECRTSRLTDGNTSLLVGARLEICPKPRVQITNHHATALNHWFRTKYSRRQTLAWVSRMQALNQRRNQSRVDLREVAQAYRLSSFIKISNFSSLFLLRSYGGDSPAMELLSPLVV